MPAVSQAQRDLMAIAEHDPSKVWHKNRGVLKMNKQQLHDFAATKGLRNKHVKKGGKSNVAGPHALRLANKQLAERVANQYK